MFQWINCLDSINEKKKKIISALNQVGESILDKVLLSLNWQGVFQFGVLSRRVFSRSFWFEVLVNREDIGTGLVRELQYEDRPSKQA